VRDDLWRVCYHPPLTCALDGHDLADEGLELGCAGGDVKGFAEHGFGFVEKGGVLGEEGDEGLAFGEVVA